MKTNFPRMMLLAMCVLLVGCETTGDSGGLSGDDALGAEGQAAGGQSGAEAQGLQAGQGILARELNDPSSPLSKRVIYFMYDSAEVKPEYIPIIEAHARFMANHSELQVELEGHADERGSREYNIALGEQRANSVARRLGLQGVDDTQIRIVSFGEEKPMSYGHDESAWQQNRRVEIVYPGY